MPCRLEAQSKYEIKHRVINPPLGFSLLAPSPALDQYADLRQNPNWKDDHS